MIPVLEVGGTHAGAALVDPGTWAVSAATRLDLDADAGADELVARFVAAAGAVPAPAGATWGVAMPDPFDYPAGVARFQGVGKFGALYGVDVGGRLRAALEADVVFVNDADAFALGEWAAGAARGAARCAAITLGTGVGSGWLVDGVVVDPGFPPGGRIHRAQVSGEPLEERMSRRAIRRAFVEGGGDPGADVREIAGLARTGDPLARRVLDDAFTVLGRVVAAALAGFGADVLVIGGSMAASWDVFEAAFRAGADGIGAGAAGVDADGGGVHAVGVHAAAGLGAHGARLPEIRVSADADRTGLIGAAVHASRSR